MENNFGNDELRLQYHHQSYGHGPLPLVIRLHNWWWKYSDNLPLFGVLLFAVIYPLFQGGGNYTGLSMAAIWMSLMLGLSLFIYWQRHRSITAYIFPWPLWLIAGPLLLGIIQLLPLGVMVKWLSPASYLVWQEFNQAIGRDVIARISIAPTLTLYFVELLAICLVAGFIVVNHCRSYRLLRWIFIAVVASASISAFYGDIQLLIVKFWRNDTEPFAFCGSFFNRNHFAFLSGIGLVMGSSMLLSLYYEHCHLVRHFGRTDVNRGRFLIVSFVILLLLTALFGSLSRGGCLSFATCWILIVAGGILMLKRHRYLKNEKFLVFAIIAIGVLMMLMPALLGAISERIKNMDGELNEIPGSRLSLWRDSLCILADYWRSGVGLGSYADIFMKYNALCGRYYYAIVNNAHNDWLEFIIEIGIIPALIWFVIIFWYLFRSFIKFYHSHNVLFRWLEYGALGCILGMACHEFVDYSLRVPANALVGMLIFCCIVLGNMLPNESLALNMLNRVENQQSKQPKLKSSGLPHAYGAKRQVVLVMMLLALVLAGFSLRQFCGDLTTQRLAPILAQGTENIPIGIGDYDLHVKQAESAVKKVPESYVAWMQLAESRKIYSLLLQREIAEGRGNKDWLPLDMGKATSLEEYIFNVRKSALEAHKHLIAMRPAFCNYLIQYAELYENVAMKVDQEDWKNHPYEKEMEILGIYDYAYSYSTRWKYGLNDNVNAWLRAWRRCNVLQGLCTKENLDSIQSNVEEKILKLLDRKKPDYADIFRKLEYISPNIDRLLRVNFDTVEGKISFAEYLCKKDRFADAEAVMSDVLGELWNLPVEERGEDFEKQWNRACSLQLLITSNNQQNYNQSFACYYGIDFNNVSEEDTNFGIYEEIDRCEEQIKSEPKNWRLYLKMSRLYWQLSKFDSAAKALLPVTYAYKNEIPCQCLHEIWRHVSEMSESKSGGVFSNVRFVHCALTVMCGELENKPDGWKDQQLNICLSELLNMEIYFRNVDKRTWVQYHLVPYYVGRIYELLNNKDEAINAYKRMLSISPNNLYGELALRRLGAMESRKNDIAEDDLYRQYIMAPGIVLVPGNLAEGICANYPTYCKYSDVDKRRVKLLCVSDVVKEYAMVANFSNGGRKVYTTPAVPIDARSMLVWRVGEVYEYSIVSKPLLDGLIFSKRRLNKGTFEISLQMNDNNGHWITPKPKADFIAGQIDPE